MLEHVRDGYFVDLPEDIQTTVMNIHKLIVSEVQSLLNLNEYHDLKDSQWAMSCIDEFLVAPTSKGQIGSIRVYKKGKSYKCMIQATGHFRNHEYGWIEELLHEIIKRAYVNVKPKVRKYYNFTITNEGDKGDPLEGFDVYPPAKRCEEIWNKLEDRKAKAVKESVELFNEIGFNKKKSKSSGTDSHKTDSVGFDEKSLSDDTLKSVCRSIEQAYVDGVKELKKNYKMKSVFCKDDYNGEDTTYDDIFSNFSDGDRIAGELPGELKSSYNNQTKQNEISGYWEFFRNYGLIDYIADDKIEEFIDLQKKIFTKELPEIMSKMYPDIDKYGKLYWDCDHDDREDFYFRFNPATAEKIYLDIKKAGQYKEQALQYSSYDEFFESMDKEPVYNTDMNEAEAKRTLGTLSATVINDPNKVTQYTVNTYSNIITKNLLPKWAHGYQKFTITLDSYQSDNTVEFKSPKMSQDFVSRFIAGRETINGLLHQNTEIKLKVSPKIFQTMKNRDDAYYFFRSAIKYYDSRIEKYAESLATEAMKLGREMKHLISTTKLSGIVTYPMSLLFKFTDVDMTNRNTFDIKKEDIKAINSFVKNISAHYSSPEKEKKAIVDDIRKMVQVMREYFPGDENYVDLNYLSEEVNNLYDGKYENTLKELHESLFVDEIDREWERSRVGNVKAMTEKFGVKKLKKIPADLVSYIIIEAESIKDANDKMMISSYCLSKVEIVEWYIELLEVGSKKYVVPHTKPYLEGIRTQLLAAHKKIMDTPIPKADRPIVDIKYPKGYEG